jgi:hypothetical protein
MLLFSLGLFHEFYKSSLEETYGTTEASIRFREQTINKSQLMEMLNQMDADILENLIVMPRGFFQEDEQTFETWFYFAFVMKDGKMCLAEEIYDNLINSNFWIEGNYFTSEQYENGEHVAIAGYRWDEEGYKYKMQDNMVVVDGVSYRCIGKLNATDTPWVPFTTVTDNFGMVDVVFGTRGHGNLMTKSEYVAIVDAARSTFGDEVEISDYPIESAANKGIYYSIFLICIIIAIITAIIYAVLYQYIVLARKRTLGIFRLSGLSIRRAKRMYTAECMILAVVSYLCAFLIFYFVLYPKACAQYYYFDEAYTAGNYLLFTVIYMSILYGIVKWMICANVKEQIWR